MLFLLFYYFICAVTSVEYFSFLFSGVASALNIMSVYRRKNFKYYIQILKITFLTLYNSASGSRKVRPHVVTFRIQTEEELFNLQPQCIVQCWGLLDQF
jgi:hypothetical protein